MNGLDDDDMAAEAERVAAMWADYERTVKATTVDLRESVIALVTARLIGEPDGPVDAALWAKLADLEHPVLADVLVRVLWDGGPSAEDVARKRLAQLQDVLRLPGKHRAGA